MPEKKPQYTVTDRRKFTLEGALREEEAAAPEQPEPQPRENASSESASQATSQATSQVQETKRETPAEPPSAGEDSAEHSGEGAAEEAADEPTDAESAETNEEYRASAGKLDDLLGAGGDRGAGPMNFERMVQSIYMTAAVQMGAGTPQNEQPRVDIVGARQSIDMLGVLDEKTKGNLAETEKRLLQNALFDLRMSFLEISNAIASSAQKPPKPGPR